ncbi:hypothetical protein ACS0TY_002965 [Phlomoides rotata]
MWWGNACRSKKMLMRSESRMDIQDILKMKLETMNEEPDENRALVKHHSSISNKIHDGERLPIQFPSRTFQLHPFHLLQPNPPPPPPSRSLFITTRRKLLVSTLKICFQHYRTVYV